MVFVFIFKLTDIYLIQHREKCLKMMNLIFKIALYFDFHYDTLLNSNSGKFESGRMLLFTKKFNFKNCLYHCFVILVYYSWLQLFFSYKSQRVDSFLRFSRPNNCFDEISYLEQTTVSSESLPHFYIAYLNENYIIFLFNFTPWKSFRYVICVDPLIRL